MNTGNSPFGGSAQQDASEFISFLFDHVHDETNRKRDRAGKLQNSDYPFPVDGKVISQAAGFWKAYSDLNDSLIDKYWRGVETSIQTCKKCGYLMITYNTFDALNLAFPDSDVGSTTLAELLRAYTKTEMPEGYRCDRCTTVSSTSKQTRLVRLPDILCMSFGRFTTKDGTTPQKINAVVSFPISNLDMTPWTVQGGNAESIKNDVGPEHQFRAPFVYDCQSVVVHGGTLRAGHYRAFVRDDEGGVNGKDPGAWHLFNDDRITACRVGTNERGDMTQKVYSESPTTNAYMVFYQRRKPMAS